MKKLFRKAIAVALCFAVLSNTDFSAFAKDENTAGELQTVSQNIAADGTATVSMNDMPAVIDINTEMTVVVKHYLNSSSEDGNMLFAPKTYEHVENGDTLEKLIREAQDFQVKSVMLYEMQTGNKTGNGTDIRSAIVNNSYKLEKLTAKDYVIEVIYGATSGEMKNDVTFFDYINGRANDERSINYTGNYPKDVAYNQRMSLKGAEADYETLLTQTYYNYSGDKQGRFNINAYERRDYNYKWGDYRYNHPILTGLLQGLDGDNYSNVNFTFTDPGFFSAEAKAGKTILDGYKFLFQRSGMTYTLNRVIHDDVKKVNSHSLSNNFFPLPVDGSSMDAAYNDPWKNDYFGIRYDFTFKLGDYIGDMMYSFCGDDDLWVCLDGQVILDLGGIHDSYPSGGASGFAYAPGSVDVWAKLLGKTNYSVEDKINYISVSENAEKVHTITVLFMERGGNQSTCQMKFVMPNVVASPAVITSAASLPIAKVDEGTKAALSGAEFVLTKQDGTTAGSGTTDENGHLTFTDLTEGTYKLTETKAPSGYTAAGPWIVTVSKTTSENTTLHYVSKVVTEADQTMQMQKQAGYYVIGNSAATDLIDYDKKAELLNEQDRTYKINITAQVKATNVSFENVQVIDYIDPCFEITQESKAALLKAGAVISEENGMQVVSWSDVKLTDTKWSGEIIVKAKNDFLGGSQVTTNGPESKLVVGGRELELPQPKVDVRLLTLSLTGGEKTIFLGEEVTPMEYWKNEVEGSLKAVYENSKKEVVSSGIAALTQAQCEELFTKGSTTVAYSYGGNVFGNLVYTIGGAPLKVHAADAVGSPYEVYTISVSYQAKNRAESPDTGLYGSATAECEYKVNVIAGMLTIEKTIAASDYDKLQGDPVFIFKISKNGSFFAYKMVRFSEMTVNTQQDGKVTLTAGTLESLEKGNYTVEELQTMRFTCTDITISGSAKERCDVEKKTAVFEIGYDKDNKPVKTEGTAVFTNKKTVDDNFSDTDAVVNICSFDKDGNLVWRSEKSDKVQQ